MEPRLSLIKTETILIGILKDVLTGWLNWQVVWITSL